MEPRGTPFQFKVRLKRIKQDQRLERPELRGDDEAVGDWVRIGDTPSQPLFSIRLWMQRLLAFHGAARPADRPFFVAPSERAVPLTYGSAMRHVRLLYAKASSEDEAHKYGLHSLRVTGYTLAKRGAGESLAVAQGGWHSDAHSRYERFTPEQVQGLPSAMLASQEAPADGVAPAPVVWHPPLPAAVASSSANEATAAALLPARTTAAGAASRQGVPTIPNPLTLANCVGRRVLCPASMWPSWTCREHGGEGWEARVDKSKGDGTVLVTFVTQGPRSRKWKPMWLQLAHLRPV